MYETFYWGILLPATHIGTPAKKEERIMGVKGWAITMGVGAAAGAVGILMMSRTNPARRLAAEAANKVEDAAWKISDKLNRSFDI